MGRKGSGKSALLEEIKKVRSGSTGHDPGQDRLRIADLREVDFYTANVGKESARDRATRRHAVKKALQCDLLLLVLDIRTSDHAMDLAFLQDWGQWYIDHPESVAPPAIAVLTHADDSSLEGTWNPPHDWMTGTDPREVAVRARIDELRLLLPPLITEITVGIPPASLATMSQELAAMLARLLRSR